MDSTIPLQNKLLENGEHSLITNANFEKGEIIYELNGRISEVRQRETIEVGEKQHIFDELAQYINHSFNPNIEVIHNKLVACKAITKGEEIRFDYTQNESSIAAPFTCHQTGILVDTEQCLSRAIDVEALTTS